MKLQDIKPGLVIWNQWEYSIMGREKDIKSAYILVLEVGETKEVERDGKKYQSISCVTKYIDEDIERTLPFNEHEIQIGWLRIATKSEIKKMKLEAIGRIEKKIVEHKTQVGLLEIELSDLGDKYDDFIDKAI
jgi:hypothetical protein